MSTSPTVEIDAMHTLKPLADLAHTAARELAGAVEHPEHWSPVALTLRLMAERAEAMLEELVPAVTQPRAAPGTPVAEALATVPQAIAAAMGALDGADAASLQSPDLRSVSSALVRAAEAQRAWTEGRPAEPGAALPSLRSRFSRGRPATHPGNGFALAQLSRALEAFRAAAMHARSADPRRRRP